MGGAAPKGIAPPVGGEPGTGRAPHQGRPQTALFFKVDPDLGTRVARGLGLDTAEVERLAGICQEERVEATRQ